MTASYNPAEVERLLAGVRPHVEVMSADVIRTGPLEQAVNWLHANLRAMADQLEAARREIERLTGLELARADAQTARKAWTERDAARGDLEAARERIADLERQLSVRVGEVDARDTFLVKARTELEVARAEIERLTAALPNWSEILAKGPVLP